MLRTRYEFVLPRGFLDDAGEVHRRGVMRLATARDELEPLRDPDITGPDDPRLTLLVLARVIESIGSHTDIGLREVEQLFAADIAYLQDFYGVINFGTEDDVDALLAAQAEADREVPRSAPAGPTAPPSEAGTNGNGNGNGQGHAAPEEVAGEEAEQVVTPPRLGRRASIQEVPSSSR